MSNHHFPSSHLCKIIVYSSSPNSFKTKPPPNFLNKNLIKIRNMLCTLPSLSITISPLPSTPNSSLVHCLELADRALSTHIITYSYTYYDTKHIEHLNNQYINDNIKHEHTRTNNTFKKFFPTHNIPNFITNNFYTTSILSGHGPFGAFLSKIGKVSNGSCPCDNNTLQTIEHLLIQCPQYKITILNTYNKQHNSLHSLINTKNNYTHFKHISKLIYNTLQQRL